MSDRDDRPLDLYADDQSTGPAVEPELRPVAGPELDLYEDLGRQAVAAAGAEAGAGAGATAAGAPAAGPAASGAARPGAMPPEWVASVWMSFPRDIRERYEARTVIGQGGMGIVLEAHDRQMDRVVAIKGLRDPASVSGPMRRRQAHEARICAHLTHPNILPVFDLWQDAQGNPWYSMLRVPGEAPTLARRLDQLRDVKEIERRPLAELLSRYLQVCRAMAYAHGEGVVHRDLKPDNIFLGPSGEALVADWGVAAELGRAGDTPDHLVGTPGYASPEQSGQVGVAHAAPASDIYSLGVILFELVAGRHHLAAPTMLRSATPVARPGADALIIPERVPRELAAIIRKATAWRSSERYASVLALIQALDTYMAGGLLEGINYSPRERIAKWLRAHPALGGAVASGLLFVGLLAYHLRRQRELFVDAEDALAVAFAQKAVLDEETSRYDRARHYAALAVQTCARNQCAPPQEASAVLSESGGTGWLIWSKLTPSECDSVDFTPDQTGVVTGHADGKVRVWDCLNGAVQQEVTAHAGPVRWMAHMPDGGALATAGDDGLIRIRAPHERAAAGEVVLDGAGGPLASVDMSATCSLVAVTAEGSVLLWDKPRVGAPRKLALWGATPANLPSLPSGRPAEHPPRPLCCVFPPPVGDAVARSIVAIGCDDRTLRLWNAADGDEISAMRDFTSPVDVIAVSPDGSVLACSGQGSSVQLWDMAGWHEAGKLEAHATPVSALAFSPSGDLLASGGTGGLIVLWNWRTREPLGQLEGHEGRVRALRFAPDGRTLASIGDRTLRLWDTWRAHGPDRMEAAPAPAGAVLPPRSLAFGPAARTLEAIGRDGEKTIFDLPTRAMLWRIAAPAGPTGGNARAIAGSPDSPVGRGLQTTGASPFATGTGSRSPGAPGGASGDASANGSGAQPTVESADGAREARATVRGDIELFDRRSGRPTATLTGCGARVTALAWGASALVACASEDRQIRLWDAATGALLGHIAELHAGVRCLALSADGVWMAAGFEDGSVRLWDLRPFLSPEEAATAVLVSSHLREKGVGLELMQVDDTGLPAYAPQHPFHWLSATDPDADWRAGLLLLRSWDAASDRPRGWGRRARQLLERAADRGFQEAREILRQAGFPSVPRVK